MPRARLLREGAERRFAAHLHEIRNLIDQSETNRAHGDYDETASSLEAALSAVAAAIGTARELHLLYTVYAAGE
jgi:hypothetical protein